MKLIIDIDEEWYSYIIASKDHIDEDDEAYLILNGVPYEERPQDDIFPMEIVAGECPIKVGGNCPLQPQGEWTIGYTAKQKKVAVCNLCNCISFQGKTNFCHNCGAKMQKGGAE